MSRPLVRDPVDRTVHPLAPDTPIFLGSTVRRLPVVEKGKLVGAIARFDILRAIQAQAREARDRSRAAEEILHADRVRAQRAPSG